MNGGLGNSTLKKIPHVEKLVSEKPKRITADKIDVIS